MLGKTKKTKQAEKPKANGQTAAPSRAKAKARHKLGDLLLQSSAISPQQLDEALVQQKIAGKKLGSLLLEIGAIDEAALAGAIARQQDLPLTDLASVDPEAEALALIPESLARSTNSVPVSLADGVLNIAIADPTDEQVLGQLRTATQGLELSISVAPAPDIRRTIDRSYRALAGVERHVQEFVKVEATRQSVGTVAEAISEDAPVVRIVNLMVTQGLRDRASDIHIEPKDTGVRIRYRVDGALHDVLALPESMGLAIVSRIKILANMNIVERQRPQDGQIEMEVDGRPLDIRVSTTPTIWGEKAVLRLLDKAKPLFRLDDLGMAPDIREVFDKIVRSPVGMMICAGPTGSGKTTTLYATLNEVDDPEKNVMTVEDPVEYVFPSINQIQIKEQTGVSFAHGLRSILRQDPDTILVGEIRDAETARIAVQSALTGHLVLSSIHATDAVSALHRFLDMGIEPFLIASAVSGVIGQRLVRRICLHCRTSYKPSAEETAFLKEAGVKVTTTTFYQGLGCNFCANTGYQERIGVYELLQVNDEMRQLIVRHASHDKLMVQALKQGMRPLRNEAIRLVEEGWTTTSEVLRTIYAT